LLAQSFSVHTSSTLTTSTSTTATTTTTTTTTAAEFPVEVDHLLLDRVWIHFLTGTDGELLAVRRSQVDGGRDLLLLSNGQRHLQVRVMQLQRRQLELDEFARARLAAAHARVLCVA
jgi:hypothetical protein